MYQPRTYRSWTQEADLIPFQISVRETDLYILARTDLHRKARRLVMKYREMLELYIRQHPEFLSAMSPLSIDETAPHIVKTMLVASEKAGVGPMASVAGALAESVGAGLAEFSSEVIVENGGDIYLKSLKSRKIGVYAGDSPLTGRIGIEIPGDGIPLGVCTSSGTVGHSLSHGRADAVIVLSPSVALADAAATAIGNVINTPDDFDRGFDTARGISGLTGVMVVLGAEMGVWGDIKICRT